MTQTRYNTGFFRKTTLTVLACAIASIGSAMAEPTDKQERLPLTHFTLKKTGNEFAAFDSGLGPIWWNNTVQWSYNPVGQPYYFSTDEVLMTIARAALKWSEVCNIQNRYMGLTGAVPDIFTMNISQTDGINTIGWLPFNGNLTYYDSYTLMWSYNDYGTELVWDVDTALNAYLPFTIDELEGLMTQQMGYFIGLPPSGDPNSVLYPEAIHSYQYLRTLHISDVAACGDRYGLSPKSNINRIFNWAEVVFPELFSPPGRLTMEIAGFNARYYEHTNSYTGELNGMIYILLPGWDITLIGSVDDLLATAVSQGF